MRHFRLPNKCVCMPASRPSLRPALSPHPNEIYSFGAVEIKLLNINLDRHLIDTTSRNSVRSYRSSSTPKDTELISFIYHSPAMRLNVS